MAIEKRPAAVESVMTIYDTPTQSDFEMMPEREARHAGLDIHDIEKALHMRDTLEKWRSATEYKKELVKRVRARRHAVFQKLGTTTFIQQNDHP